MADRKYDKIIALPHHVSVNRPGLPPESYAAQFSPFAALTGYDGMIEETARFTEEKKEREESGAEELDRKLACIEAMISSGVYPEISVRYFSPDETKKGGKYLSYNGPVKRIDHRKRTVVFEGGFGIKADDISDISGSFSEDF